MAMADGGQLTVLSVERVMLVVPCLWWHAWWGLSECRYLRELAKGDTLARAYLGNKVRGVVIGGA